MHGYWKEENTNNPKFYTFISLENGCLYYLLELVVLKLHFPLQLSPTYLNSPWFTKRDKLMFTWVAMEINLTHTEGSYTNITASKQCKR